MIKNISKIFLGRVGLPMLLFSSLFITIPVQAQDPLPEGEAKVVLNRSCNRCHPADQVSRQRKTEDQWQATVVRMQGRGADISTPEVDTVVKYLVKNFGKVEDTTKVNVNKASSEDLVAKLGFSKDEADAIVDYRDRKGDFREWGELLQIYGVSGEKVQAAKDKMTF
jgi:competence ComEA-like helix-hairpin-helix protein